MIQTLVMQQGCGVGSLIIRLQLRLRTGSDLQLYQLPKVVILFR